MNIDFQEYATRFQKIEEALKAAKTERLIVLAHDNPDPDSVSSAFALAHILKNRFKIPTSVKYGGIVGRAENRAMIRVLGLHMKPLEDGDFKPGTEFALVDMQPKTGNNSFPKNRKPMIVIDHHPLRKTTKADYLDIRTDYGATATVLTEYLIASGLEIPGDLATALSYGISSETQDLGREAREKDLEAYLALFPLSNKKILSSIEHPKLSRDHFITLNRALHHSSVYKNAIATTLGEISNPDFVPFTADFLLRLERMSWAICLGRYHGKIIVSIRTTNAKGEAGRFLRRLIGKRGTAGGHGMIAGGQIACGDGEHETCTKIEDEIIQDFLKKLGYKDAGGMTPLLTPESIHD
jgi:nanoRNase/pAp phosphatase (c-di-AMP/oligoRNAs hydrolase)